MLKINKVNIFINEEHFKSSPLLPPVLTIDCDIEAKHLVEARQKVDELKLEFAKKYNISKPIATITEMSNIEYKQIAGRSYRKKIT